MRVTPSRASQAGTSNPYVELNREGNCHARDATLLGHPVHASPTE